MNLLLHKALSPEMQKAAELIWKDGFRTGAAVGLVAGVIATLIILSLWNRR